MKALILTCGISLAFLGVFQIAEGRAAAAQANRERMETDIRRQLSPLVGIFDNVTFKVEPDRTVTLFGQVRDPFVKSHVAEDTKRVAGVQGVHDQIEMLPISGADDDLRIALYRAIYSQQGLQRYTLQVSPPIHIIVKNGAVSLEGVVATRMESIQADVAANHVSGAFSVKNNLRVEREG